LRWAGKTRHCFLEVDRSTEELDRLKRKYVNYWWYLQSREFLSTADPVDTAVVLFATTGRTRLTNMRTALRNLQKPNRAAEVKRGMFWFCLENDYSLEAPESILSPIWRTGSAAAQKQSLGWPPPKKRPDSGDIAMPARLADVR